MKPFLEKMTINFNLLYQGKIIKVKLPSYKSIRHLKDLAKEACFILRQDIHLTYKNRDITKLEHCLIGDYFKSKNNIFIKVSIDSGSYPVLQSSSRSVERPLYLCMCRSDIIAHYCRECKKFICNLCRVSDAHVNHKVVQVDINNFEESIKLYAITLQGDILYNINNAKDFNDNFKERLTFDDSLSRHEMIKQKYDHVRDVYMMMIGKLYENQKDKETNIDKVVKDYENNVKGINEELDMIISMLFIKYTKVKRRMKMKDAIKIYEDIHTLEEQLEKYSHDIMIYRVNKEMNDKLNIMYNKIEQILDDMSNINFPLRLDPNTPLIYKTITQSRPDIIIESKKEPTKEVLKEEEKKDIIEVKKRKVKPIKIKEKIVVVAKDKEGGKTNKEEDNDKVELKYHSRDNMPYDQEVVLSKDTINNTENTDKNDKVFLTEHRAKEHTLALEKTINTEPVMNIDIINTNENNDIKEPLQKSINKATINEITDEDNNNKAKENKEEINPQPVKEEKLKVEENPIEESKPVKEEKVNKDNNVKEQIHIKMDSTMYQPAFNIEDDGILELENK